MRNKDFWVIRENGTGDYYYYMGYYKNNLPCFNMAIADAIHIVSAENALQIQKILNEILSCEIIKVEARADW